MVCYHLHVVYVPVVQKEVYFKKNNKDPALAGKLKEVIPQISQNRKWSPRLTVEIDGKTVTRNSYSFLQDRYYQHMKAAGFEGFERGERGSTTEHLEVLDYKIQQDTKRLNSLSAQVERKAARSDALDKQITVKEKAKATIAEVEAMGKPQTLGSGFVVTDGELKKLKSLAKKGVGIDKRAEEYKRKMETLEGNIRDMGSQINSLKQDIRSITTDRNMWKANYERLWAEVKDFIGAIRSIPNRLRAFIAEHLPGKSKNREAI